MPTQPCAPTPAANASAAAAAGRGMGATAYVVKMTAPITEERTSHGGRCPPTPAPPPIPRPPPPRSPARARPRGSQGRERPPAREHGRAHHDRASNDGGAPAEDGGGGRRDERGDDAAHRQPHLLDPHRDAALAHRKEIDDGLAQHRVDHAPADTGQEDTGEEYPEARR